MKTIKDLMTEQWNKPGVHHAGHLVAWEANALSHSLVGRQGTFRRPTWDKALLKRAKRDLPNWYATRNDRYY